MEIDKVFNGDVDGVADNLFSAVKNSVSEIKAMQQRKAAENVQLVIQALKKIESDLQDKFDGVTTVIEKRVASLKDGRDGVDGRNGRDGKDGRPGRDGADGPRGPAGAPGRDGRDGVDGVSVTDAHIDFDGSLIISLSSGRTINVGEVVAPDLAEKIKVITNGGGTSQSVLDSLASLQSQITALQNLGAVNYVGTWNASTNTPTITGGSGEKGDYYVVSVAGSTSIDGQTLWGVGDWIIFNGTAWQKVDGGSTGDFTNLSVSGAVTLSGGTANGVAYLNGSKALTTGSALWFDGSNLGIGTSSPAYKLDVSGSNPRIRVAPTTGTEFALFQANNTGGNAFIGLENSAGSALSTGAAYSLNLYHGGAYPILFSTSATERMRITSSGDVGIGTTSPTRRVTVGGTANALMDFNATSYRRYSIGSDANGFVLYDDTAGAYRLTVNSSGNMGIGTSSPGHKLEVAGGSYLNGNILTNSGSTFYNATGDLYIRSGTSGALRFGSNGSNDRLILDTSGTLGLAVTPSAWGSEHAAFQLGFSGAIQSYKAGTTAEYLSVISNAYNDNANWRYIRDGAATRYELFEGAHRWFSSASGTAGNAISFTQAMTLDTSGRLGIGTSSPSAQLHVNGTGAIFSYLGYNYAAASQVVSSADAIFGGGVIADTPNATQVKKTVADDGHFIRIQISDGIAFHTGLSGAAGATFSRTANERMRLDASGNLIANSSVTGHWQVPRGTTAQRTGSPASGMIRFNTTLSRYEGHNGTGWASIGGGATGGGSDDVFYENGQTVTTNYTITTNKNAMSAGPVTIASGITVTVPSGSTWVVV